MEKKLKDAGGKPQNVDWKALAEDLKKELPAGSQHMVDVSADAPVLPTFG